jgi:hypothetical protein
LVFPDANSDRRNQFQGAACCLGGEHEFSDSTHWTGQACRRYRPRHFPSSPGAPDFLSQITKDRPLSISAEPSATLGREAMRIIAKTDPFVRVRL